MPASAETAAIARRDEPGAEAELVMGNSLQSLLQYRRSGVVYQCPIRQTIPSRLHFEGLKEDLWVFDPC
jgi:hypothetical protein